MRKRIFTLLIAVLAVAAFGGTSVATAQHGADDPAGHVRHSGEHAPGHIRHSGDDDPKVTATHRAHRRARHGHGADDRSGHVRRGHGADDDPNHD